MAVEVVSHRRSGSSLGQQVQPLGVREGREEVDQGGRLELGEVPVVVEGSMVVSRTK